jgi:hypothetical protein
MKDPDKHLLHILLCLSSFSPTLVFVVGRMVGFSAHDVEEDLVGRTVVFSTHDVKEETKESNDPGPLKLVLLCKKLGYIFVFAKYGTLDTEMMMNQIVQVIEEAKAGSTKGEETVKKVGLDKKIVPVLEMFSGDDKDFMHSRIQQ